MKKRFLSLLCVLALVISLFPTMVLAKKPDISLGLTATATQSDGVTKRELDQLHAGDIVTVQVTLPASTYSSVQFKLGFDKTVFKTKFKDIAPNFVPEANATTETDGWANVDAKLVSSKDSVAAVAIGNIYDEDVGLKPGDITITSDLEVLTVKFTVLDTASVGKTGAFSILNTSAEDLAISRRVDGKETLYTVGLPDPISTTVVKELSTVALTGSVTTPTKGGADVSNVTGDNVDVNVSWSPELVNNKFAASTEYTATAKVTPKTGYVFADGMTVSGLEGYSFSKQSDGSYQASYTYAKTSDKSITGLEVTTQPATKSYTHGDTFDTTDMVVKASYDDGSVDENFTGYSIVYADGAKYLKKDVTAVTLSAGGKTAEVTGLTVNAKALSITELTAIDRVYDGTKTVGITNGTLNGVITGETVDVTTMPTSGTMEDANVGDGKTVTVTKPDLTGADAGNYTLKEITGVKVNIIPAGYEYTYGGTTSVTIGNPYPVTDTSAKAKGVDKEEVSGTLTWFTDAARSKPATGNFEKEGKQTLYWTFEPDQSNTNYSEEPQNGEVEFEVSALPTQDVSFNVKTVDKTYGDDSFTESAANKTSGGGAITYSSSNMAVATVNESTGEVTIVGAGTAVITATAAKVPTKYAETTATYTLNVAKREVTLTWRDYDNLVYDGTAKTVTASVSNKVGSDDVSVTVSNGDQINAGTYTATATGLTGERAENYVLPESLPTQEYTIAPKTITPTVTVTGTYTYNGTAQTPTYTVTDTSVDPAVELVKDRDYTETLSNNTNAGEATLTITAKEGGNYAFTAVSESFTIVPIQLTAANLLWTDGYITKSYDGTTTCGVTALTITGTGVATVDGQTISGTAVYNAADVKDAIKITFTPNAITTGNYVLAATETKELDATITPVVLTADNLVYAGDPITKKYDGTNSGGEAILTITGHSVSALNGQQINGTYLYTGVNAGTNTATFTPTPVTVADGKNYTIAATETKTIAAEITATDQYTVNVNAEQNVVVGDGTFTEPTFIGYNDEEVAGTLTYTYGGEAETAEQIKDILSELSVGDTATIFYEFTPAVGGNYEGTKSGDITVTIVEDSVATIVRDGQTLKYASLQDAVNDVRNNETITLNANLTEKVTATVNCAVRFKLDANGNDSSMYSITAKSGYRLIMKDNDTYVVVKAGGGGGGGGSSSSTTTTYAIKTDPATNGTIKTSRTYAAKGDSVTITLTPAEGYVVDTLTVKDANGNTIEVIKTSDTVYKFVMTNSKVTVAATFGEKVPFDTPDTSDTSDTSDTMPFVDVSTGGWFYDAVYYAYKNGLMNGIITTEFAPYDTATRAMVVTILWRMEGSPVVDYNMPFTDVPADQWYTEAVRWAVSTDVVKGISDTEFDPDGDVTREELATMIYRIQQNQGNGFIGDWMFNLTHDDAYLVSDWANEAIHWCVMNGVLNGDDNNRLNPQNNATRAEIATIFMNLKNLEK